MTTTSSGCGGWVGDGGRVGEGRTGAGYPGMNIAGKRLATNARRTKMRRSEAMGFRHPKSLFSNLLLDP